MLIHWPANCSVMAVASRMDCNLSASILFPPRTHRTPNDDTSEPD
jgi:hypothetical protein